MRKVDAWWTREGVNAKEARKGARAASANSLNSRTYGRRGRAPGSV